MKKYAKAWFFIIALLVSYAHASIIYTVKKGDTLWKISKKNGVSMEAILRSNPELKNEKGLKVGMALVIPDPSEEIIPVEETTQTRTFIVHGAAKQNCTPLEKTVNIMTVGSKRIKVPTYHPPRPKKSTSKSYRSKYHKLSSRGFIKGNAIVKTAFKFLGVPYVFGGSTPRGFDCSGFVQYVYRLNGIKTPRMAHHQYYAGTPIPKSQLRPGDLVFFETYTKGISHVGIYIGNGKFIHASSSGHVKISSLNQPYYKSRYRGAARYYR